MIVALCALSPNRPKAMPPSWREYTIFARPEMPSPSVSSGSAFAIISVVGIASNNPNPIICGAIRGATTVSGCNAPYARSSKLYSGAFNVTTSPSDRVICLSL